MMPREMRFILYHLDIGMGKTREGRMLFESQIIGHIRGSRFRYVLLMLSRAEECRPTFGRG